MDEEKNTQYNKDETQTWVPFSTEQHFQTFLFILMLSTRMFKPNWGSLAKIVV